MPSKVNLADPGFEPSDEDLVRLSHEAFADVAETNERALEAMRRRIAAQSLAVQAEFAVRGSRKVAPK